VHVANAMKHEAPAGAASAEAKKEMTKEEKKEMKTEKKMKKKALYTILSQKFRDNQLMFLNKIVLTKPKTKDAVEKGVRIYTIGIGSPAGAPIPIYNANGQQSDFKRDRSGNVVLTKLDETSLQEIAAIGKGKYFRATNSQDELDAIYKEINGLEKREFGAKQFTEYDDKFQYFLFAALILLFIEVILSDKRTEWLAQYNPFRGLRNSKGMK